MVDRGGRLYVGLDSSTQSLTAIAIEVTGRDARVAFEASLAFDEAFPQYGTDHGVLVADSTHHASAGVRRGEAMSSPVMWAEALDTMLGRLAAGGLDTSRIAAISGSAQQHGSVYLNHDAERLLATLDASRPLAGQIAPMLSRAASPIWLDSSTSEECRQISDAVGGPAVLARRTGSRAFERFTGPQIRKFAAVDPAGYAATGRIHLVSSFLASLLADFLLPCRDQLRHHLVQRLLAGQFRQREVHRRQALLDAAELQPFALCPDGLDVPVGARLLEHVAGEGGLHAAL